jgi:hypothetical protein
MPIIFHSGSKYILTFIDDYTKKTWLYFLFDKSQILDYFKNFQALIETFGNLSSDSLAPTQAAIALLSQPTVPLPICQSQCLHCQNVWLESYNLCVSTNDFDICMIKSDSPNLEAPDLDAHNITFD